MSKSTDMAKVSVKGGFYLLLGLVISTVISAVGTVFINNRLDPDNTGLYTIVLAVPVLIATFGDWGINTAMIRYIAKYNSENDTTKIRSIFASGLIFQLALGLVLTIISIALAGFMTDTVYAKTLENIAYNKFTIVQLIQIASISGSNWCTDECGKRHFYGYGSLAP